MDEKPDGEREFQGWKCRLCGMGDNVLPYCANCGKARGGGQEVGCAVAWIVILLLVAGTFGTCAVQGIDDKSQSEYWGPGVFWFSLIVAAFALAGAIWTIWRIWPRSDE